MSKEKNPSSLAHPPEVVKRDGSIAKFDLKKIEAAVEKAMKAVCRGSIADAKSIAAQTCLLLMKKGFDKRPGVETIQDHVEESLMASDFHDAAKAYILYREKRALDRKKDIFKRRVNMKPYEYPELAAYTDAIRHSYWIHTEFNFTSDIQDWKVHVKPHERSALKNAMLAIAQIEVAVKTFWGNIYSKMPKPEIGSVGFTFAESEVRHQDAYSHLLELLGLNEEFKRVREIPVIIERVEYLDRSIKNSRSDDNRLYAESILLFSLFIEHVSLFSQFLVIMSFNKHRNLFKGISNAVEATSKEEQIHGLFGIDVINIIKKENPAWFDERLNESIIESCRRAYESEARVIDWIYEGGELEFLPKQTVKEFVKNRFNNSLFSIGLPRIFEVDAKALEETEWFDDEVIGTKHGDFFVKRSINYNKRNKSVTSKDLF